MVYSLLAGALKVETLTIPIQGLPRGLGGTTLVHLTDFHFDGLRLSVSLLEQAIAAANAAKPDLILLTGDYVTDDPQPIGGLAQHLTRLQSRLGTYAVLGNHDLHYPHSHRIISQALADAGIQVLWDQVVYPLGESVALVGLRDYWSRYFNPAPVMQFIDPDTPRIVLSHNPDSAKTLSRWRVDLQLSGHTHGGQVIIPGVGPAVLGLKRFRKRMAKPMRRWMPLLTQNCDQVVQHWEWAQGLHRINQNLLYVNRGLGTYLPGRLFCPPEVTVITLQCP